MVCIGDMGSCYTGNPVSCFVTFYLYVFPSLRGLSGFTSPLLPTIKVRLAADVSYIDFRDVSNVKQARLDPRPEYHRATINTSTADGIPLAISTGSQHSSRLLSARSVNVLLVLPPKTDAVAVLPRGEVVEAIVIAL